MSNDNIIERREIGDYRITIYRDEYAECPVKNRTLGACYVFEYLQYGHYNLSLDCNWEEWVSDIRGESVESIMRRIAAEMVEQKDITAYYKEGRVKDVRLIYDSSECRWALQYKSSANAEWKTALEVENNELEDNDYRIEMLEFLDESECYALIQKYAKDFVIKKWDSIGYSQGDYIRGIAYATKEHFDKYCGFNAKKYKTWQEQAFNVIDAEVKMIGMWAWGDVKRFTLEKKVLYTKVYKDANRKDKECYEWETVDFGGGCFMENDEIVNEVLSRYDLEEIAPE